MELLLGGVLPQAAPHLGHGPHGRILALLQPQVLAEQTHVLLVALQPGDTGLGLLRPERAHGRQGAPHGEPRAQNLCLVSYHFHHLMKKS